MKMIFGFTVVHWVEQSRRKFLPPAEQQRLRDEDKAFKESDLGIALNGLAWGFTMLFLCLGLGSTLVYWLG